VRQEGRVGTLVAGEARVRVQALGLVVVAADFGHALRDEEVEERIGLREGGRRDHRDGVECDALCAQPRHAAQHALVRATAGAGAAVRVVQTRRAIDADADAHGVALEQRAPGIVDQRGVGLDRVRDVAGRAEHVLQHGHRPVVERDRHRERLAGMPDHGEFGAGQAVVAQALGSALHRGEAHARRGIALGQVAVVAVDVAERRGLQDQQPRAQGGREIGAVEAMRGFSRRRAGRGPAGKPSNAGRNFHDRRWPQSRTCERLNQLPQLPQFGQLFQLFQLPQFIHWAMRVSGALLASASAASWITARTASTRASRAWRASSTRASAGFDAPKAPATPIKASKARSARCRLASFTSRFMRGSQGSAARGFGC